MAEKWIKITHPKLAKGNVSVVTQKSFDQPGGWKDQGFKIVEEKK